MCEQVDGGVLIVLQIKFWIVWLQRSSISKNGFLWLMSYNDCNVVIVLRIIFRSDTVFLFFSKKSVRREILFFKFNRCSCIRSLITKRCAFFLLVLTVRYQRIVYFLFFYVFILLFFLFLANDKMSDECNGFVAEVAPVSDVLIWTGVTNKDEYATTKLVLRKIPAAGQTFTMGSPTGEKGRVDSETIKTGGTPGSLNMSGGTTTTATGFEMQHSVTLTRDFYIGVFEVTQYQYWKIMNTWPSAFSLAECRNTRPVDLVSYEDIRGALSTTLEWPSNTAHEVINTSFLGKLRAALNGSPKLDLPTEAQWEYACRAKATAAWYSGFNPEYTTANTNPSGLNKIARFNMNGGILNGTTNPDLATCAMLGTTNGTARVGSYLPNAYGVYDMLGNVMEWCLDWWGPDTAGATTEPTGPMRDEATYGQWGYRNRIVRGAGYWSNASLVRAAGRWHDTHSQKERIRGFRLCLTVEE